MVTRDLPRGASDEGTKDELAVAVDSGLAIMEVKRKMALELNDVVIKSMGMGAVFKDYVRSLRSRCFRN